MAKVFTFEGFHSNKSYGDTNYPAKIVVVKGAADKDDAKSVAQKNIGALRIVNGGRAFANEAKAVEFADWKVKLINRTNKPGAPDASWFAVDAGMQRGIANLLGMNGARDRNRCSSAFIYGGDTDADYA